MKAFLSALWISAAAWCVGTAGDGNAGGPNGAAAPAPATDRVRLKDGQTVEGAVFDLTDKNIIVSVANERRTFARDLVAAIERVAPSSLLALFERKFEGLKPSGALDDWKGLALFCANEKLSPERRRVLREIVRIDPANAAARAELGHALLGEKWVDEDEVAAKLKDGYQLIGGKLVKSGVSATSTVVNTPDGVNPRYHMLGRTKLSASARKKMEKEREDRLKSADKFLEMKEKEYQGIDWTKRYKIRTKYFEIQCNSTRKVAEAYGALMELIRGKLEEMFTSTIQRNVRAPIYIYASQEEFMAQDRLGKGMGRGLGGYYNSHTQAITAFHGTFGFTGTTFGVLCHEGTHYYEGLVLQDFDNIPIWLIEGLAVYFGDGSLFDPKKARITIGQIPRDRLAHIQEKMLQKRNTSVAKLVKMTRDGRGDEAFSGSHYADAWALIYFLVNSGDKGKSLLTNYWEIGLKMPLKKEHFTELANRYFGSIDSLEKQYVDYILKLDMPPAGKVVGDYFVSDTFQFDLKAPGDDWEFFEDRDDKRMMVGLLLPGSSAEIRVYYSNNEMWAPADKYFEAYRRQIEARAKDFQFEKVTAGKLEWIKMTYSDDGRKESKAVQPASPPGGAPPAGPAAGDGPSREKENEKAKKPGRRDVVHFLLVQVDGVVAIECSVKQGEGHDLAEIYSKLNENFALTFTRRW